MLNIQTTFEFYMMKFIYAALAVLISAVIYLFLAPSSQTQTSFEARKPNIETIEAPSLEPTAPSKKNVENTSVNEQNIVQNDLAQAIDSELITTNQDEEDKEIVYEYVHSGQIQFPSVNPIFLPYIFDKQIPFNKNQTVLSQLVHTLYIQNYLTIMVDGYSLENTGILGQRLIEEITSNDKSSEVVCNNNECLLYFSNLNSDNNKPCSRLSDNQFQCKSMSFKEYDLVLIEFPQTGSMLTSVNSATPEQLIKQGFGEIIMLDYVQTKIAITRVSKKSPLSIASSQCLTNKCEFSIKNGVFAKARKGKYQTKVKLDLTPTCRLMPLTPFQDGPMNSDWLCNLL